MKKIVWVPLVLSFVLLISFSPALAFENAFQPALQDMGELMGVFGLDSSPAIEASSGFLDGVLDYLKEFAGGTLENVVGHGIWDLINGVFRPKKSVWEEHKMTIIVALVGAAILIGMILYDRSQKRGGSGSRRSRQDPFSFDDRDDDIFRSEGRSSSRSSRSRGGSMTFQDDDTDLFGDGRSPSRRPSGSPSRARLVGIEGDYAGQSIPLSGQMLTIGRSRECSLVMRDYVKGVSKKHCAIRYSASHGAYQVVDMGSTYGTYLNGRKIEPRTPKTLKRNDVIYLGSKRVGFRIG